MQIMQRFEIKVVTYIIVTPLIENYVMDVFLQILLNFQNSCL